jgi:hypothetical protein
LALWKDRELFKQQKHMTILTWVRTKIEQTSNYSTVDSTVDVIYTKTLELTNNEHSAMFAAEMYLAGVNQKLKNNKAV